MRKRIAAKIESTRGASLSMALLLMLVCTVISAVVLIAGTTVSGRFASLAKMDQRYYSIVSAVELIEDQVATSDCITVSEAIEYTKALTTDASGNEAYVYTVSSDTTTVNYNGTEVKTASSLKGQGLLVTLGRYLVFGSTENTKATSWSDDSSPIEEDTWYDTLSEWEEYPPISSEATSSSLIFNMTLSGSGNDAGLAVRVEAVFQSDGTVILNFTNAQSTGDDVGETADLTYMASITLEPFFETDANDTGSKDTKTSTLSWSVSDITMGTVSS